MIDKKVDEQQVEQVPLLPQDALVGIRKQSGASSKNSNLE